MTTARHVGSLGKNTDSHRMAGGAYEPAFYKSPRVTLGEQEGSEVLASRAAGDPEPRLWAGETLREREGRGAGAAP